MNQLLQMKEHYQWGAANDGWHLLKSESLSVIQERMVARTSEVLHYHTKAQQLFYILDGEAAFELNGRIQMLGKNESIHVPANTLHRIANRTEHDLVFLVVSEPKAHGERIEIIDFSDEYKDAIRRLNYEWLEKDFRVEEGDELSLCNPREQIIDKGGYIYYVRRGNEIVGTASLLRKKDGNFELGKMAVAPDTRGLGIGKMLITHCLNVAKQLNSSKIILYSNTKLETAIHLYKKFGFVETDVEPGLYERANIKMEKILAGY